MINTEYLEKTIQDLKDQQRYFVPDWLEKLNQLKVLEKFMNIDFSDITDEKQVLRIAENLQQELKRCGVHQRKGELTYFDRKAIYPIK